MTYRFWRLTPKRIGLGGSIAFVANPPSSLETVALNLNFDMLSRGDNGKLWASGTAHWPNMKPIVLAIAARGTCAN